MASRYEIRFNDAARADFDRLQSQAESSSEALRQLLEIHALLDQIAGGDPAQDSVVPGTVLETALRYRSEGGMFLYFQRQEDTRTVTVMLFRELHSPDQIAVSGPSAVSKLTDLRIRDISHGLETESATEFIDQEGVTRRVRSFVRRLDWGDFYTIFNHVAMDGKPPRTMITSGRKGQVEGDWRRDFIEVVELLADGSARSYPPQTVPVWLRNPFYEATSKRDMLDRLRNSPIPSARFQEIRRFLENDSDPA